MKRERRTLPFPAGGVGCICTELGRNQSCPLHAVKCPRFTVHNAQAGVDTHLRRIREPWKVIDTTTNRVVDEFTSQRAARSAAAFYNKHGINRGSWPGTASISR